MGTQFLACIPTEDQAISNPPCQQGSALVVVDASVFRPDPLDGWEQGAVIAFLPAFVGYCMGRVTSMVRGM